MKGDETKKNTHTHTHSLSLASTHSVGGWGEESGKVGEGADQEGAQLLGHHRGQAAVEGGAEGSIDKPPAKRLHGRLNLGHPGLEKGGE